MQRYSKIATACVAAMAMFGAASAQAAGTANIKNGEAIFNQGKGDVPACNSCHGPKGEGNEALGAPRLAGQIGQFLLKQLEDFATDKRQDTTMFVMNANAKGMSPQDRLDVAAYLSKLEVPKGGNLNDLAASGTPIGVSHLGKVIVLYGIPEKGVPACQSCHGYNGRGVDPVYPQLNYQSFTYLVNQLNKWRDGSRANDPLAQMRKVAQKLSDDDIRNVATYLTVASPYSMGNTRLPATHAPKTFGGH